MNHQLAVDNPALGNLNRFLQVGGGAGYFSRLLSTIVNILFVIGGLVFFFMLLIGGINWISAGSDKQKLEESRSRVMQAVIGLIVLLATWAIIKAVETILGVDILTINISALSIQ